MSSLVYKRDDSPYWYVTKTRASTKTTNRKLAEEFARKSITAAWRREDLGDTLYTWAQLADDWLDYKSEKASFDQDKATIARFGEFALKRGVVNLVDITGTLIADYGKAVKASSSASTANRHFTTIRAMLVSASRKDPQWIKSAPHIANYELVKKEVTWLRVEQVEAIIPHLPDWVADMYIFAQQTGLRFSNVAGFRWEWISAAGDVAIVPASNTKSKHTYTVPLSRKAKAVLEKLRQDMRDPVYVFVGKKRVGKQFVNGKRDQSKDAKIGVYVDCAPVDTVRYWWESAVSAVGLDNVTWHQATRHTWASHHTQNNTPDRALMQMGGWTSPRMLENYAHLGAEHLMQYADNANSEK